MMNIHKSGMIRFAVLSIGSLLISSIAGMAVHEHYKLVKQQSHWILTNGIIEEADYKDVDKMVGNGPLRRTIKVRNARCRYRYIVDGKAYTGVEIREISTLSQPRWGNYRGLKVYYNPHNPSESIIFKEPKSTPWLFIVMMVAFLALMMLYFMLFLWEYKLFISEKSFFTSKLKVPTKRVSLASIPKIFWGAIFCIILFLASCLVARTVAQGPDATPCQEIVKTISMFLGLFSISALLILLGIYVVRKLK